MIVSTILVGGVAVAGATTGVGPLGNLSTSEVEQPVLKDQVSTTSSPAVAVDSLSSSETPVVSPSPSDAPGHDTDDELGDDD